MYFHRYLIWWFCQSLHRSLKIIHTLLNFYFVVSPSWIHSSVSDTLGIIFTLMHVYFFVMTIVYYCDFIISVHGSNLSLVSSASSHYSTVSHYYSVTMNLWWQNSNESSFFASGLVKYKDFMLWINTPYSSFSIYLRTCCVI